MGGRGVDGKIQDGQLNLQDMSIKKRVEEIISLSNKIRNNIEDSSIGYSKITSNSYKQCACCREYTIPIGSEYEVCPICEWIDDDYQNMNPDDLAGKNDISLNEATRIYFNRLKESMLVTVPAD